MKLLLVRHGQSMGNATGDYSVATHDSLSPLGRVQAEALAGDLAGESFDAIFVSPLQRAVETALPLLKAAGRRALIWPELAEGCWQERAEPAAADWPAEPMELSREAAEWLDFHEGRAVRPSGTEGFGAGLRRVGIVLERLTALARSADPGKPPAVLVFGHGHFLCEFLRLALGMDSACFIHHDNCGRTELRYRGSWEVRYLNRPAPPLPAE
ncbi:MAG: histidine phosphatase family protein, partial [Puniceicoccaceae bacterium]